MCRVKIVGIIPARFGSIGANFQEFFLVQNLHAQFLRLGELGTGFGTGQDKIRFLAHAAGHFAAPNQSASASLALAMASASVSPAEAQPGSSGKTADQRLDSESNSIKRRSFMPER